MASSVYSTLLIAVVAIDPSAEYTVPAGYTVVVRDVCMLFYGSPADTSGGVQGAGDGAWIAYCLQVDPYQFYHWEGRQVIGPGDSVHALASGENEVSIRVSGYLLQNVSAR